MQTDPIADYLTRIRNATLVGHDFVEMPSSKLKVEITKLLLEEGYIRSYELQHDKRHNAERLRIMLKYNEAGYPVIRKLQRVSRPGLRKYFKANNLPRILAGAGVGVVSTSKGVMSDRAARRDKLGGELMCTVY